MSRRLRSSMRITSAPKSASSRVATAPTPIQQKSVTRTPASGPRRALGSREGSVGTSVMGHQRRQIRRARELSAIRIVGTPADEVNRSS